MSLSIAAAILLAGCGVTAVGTVPSAGNPDVLSYHKTFHYTGLKQFFKVPGGVKWMTIIALGAGGASELNPAGGLGARVHATVPVTPGERLVVYVGGAGTPSAGGFNGGGAGGSYRAGVPGYGGGGASDVRRAGDLLSERIVVAGGGGGQGGFDVYRNGNHGFGGAGGSGTGASGQLGWYPGENSSGGSPSYAGDGDAGGAQRHGGAGGAGGDGFSGYAKSGQNGTRDDGGAGGAGCKYRSSSSCGGAGGGGGGGGGGYFGGGGGGAAGQWESGGAGGGGGGGGSSYIEPSARKFQSWKGWKSATGNGLVVFGW